MSAIAECLDDVTAADVAVFVSDLVDLLRQFPSYRRFVDEARDAGPVNRKGQDAATEVARLLEAQPDEIVQPALKAAISEIRELAENQREPLAALSLVRTIGNAFRAVGRFFNKRIANISSKAIDTFDETVGKIVGKSLAYLLVATPIGGLLMLLHTLYPAEFAFVTQLLRAAKALFNILPIG